MPPACARAMASSTCAKVGLSAARTAAVSVGSTGAITIEM